MLISSGVAHTCRPFWGAYAASKAAVEVLGRTWAAETAHTPIRVTNFDPGRTRTAMRAQAAPGEDPMTLPHPSEVAEKIVPLVSPDFQESGRLFVSREDRLKDYRLPE